MGYLLKEALKTLCGVNQWSYAVFWMIGCQNPNLLIWEDCFYEPASFSGLICDQNTESALQNPSCSWISAENDYLQSCIEVADKVDFVVNKMMMDNHVNIIGQGLVGTVAFTGNYEWILSDHYLKETHQPEVLNEACQQFSAGMQTVTVIPVLPHGVVQFGSYKKIMEDVGFISDVTSLVMPLFSENNVTNEPVPRIEIPIFHGNSSPGDFSLDSIMDDSSCFNNFNYVGDLEQTSMFDDQTLYSLANEIQNDPQSNISAFQASNSSSSYFKPHDYYQEAKMDSAVQLDLSTQVLEAEVIPANSEIWLNQYASSYTSSSGGKNLHTGKKFAESDSSACKEELEENQKIKAHNIPSFIQNEHLNMAKLVSSFGGDDEIQNFQNYDVSCAQPQFGDDLFDILGAEFKNNLFNSCSNNFSITKAHNWDTDSFSSKTSQSGVFSLTGTDHLLDAMVSKVQCPAKQILDDTVSCRRTLTNNTSSTSVANSSLPYGRFGISEKMKGEIFGVSKNRAKVAVMSSCSFRTSSFKEDSITYSQLSSLTEKGQNCQEKNSLSDRYSEKPVETGKTNRKRCKLGENPKPRPKDRQMIQDRLKELREIVPNGEKCSIDALLERTIKHMLFMQSVIKHVDKLKKTGESKIISNNVGSLSKSNFEGGRTWAYEVGSQSPICPIIVEDLNQPRQMRIELHYEESGLFLEIADVVRGLGLTILNGVMETQNDKIFAHFVVEANTGVTRMEVFMSLVRLLEQTAKTGIV